jgi:hypothetical protein
MGDSFAIWSNLRLLPPWATNCPCRRRGGPSPFDFTATRRGGPRRFGFAFETLLTSLGRLVAGVGGENEYLNLFFVLVVLEGGGRVVAGLGVLSARIAFALDFDLVVAPIGCLIAMVRGC